MYRIFPAVSTALFLLLFVALTGTLDAKTEPSELALVRAKLRLRTVDDEAPPRDSVRLVMKMKGRVLPRSWSPRRDEAVIAIGGRAVISLPSVDENATARIRNDRWVYREKKSPAREARRKLVVDFEKGRIVFTASRLNLSGVDVTNLGIEIRLDGKTWEIVAPVRREGSTWIFSGRPKRFSSPDVTPGPGPGPGPMPDPDPDPDPDPGPKPVITWQELVWGHDWGNAVPDQVVADTQAEYDALWSRARGNLSKPTIDFSERMVVGIFAGKRPNAKITIVSVKREGSDVVVTYRIVADTNRYFAPPPPFPYYLFTMTKTSERIRFSLVP